MGRIPKAVKEQALDSGKKPSRRQKQASGQASTSTTDEIASSPGSDTGSAKISDIFECNANLALCIVTV